MVLDEVLARASLDQIDGGRIVWTDVATGGDAEWALSRETHHSGLVSWKNGVIASNQKSWFEMDVASPGRLSFWWKASSECDGDDIYDYSYLSIDGAELGTLNQYRLTGVAIGGKTDWTNVVLDVSDIGPHKIRWTYRKDDVDESDTGGDCVWIDEIEWTP